nr:unnamed protein product [Callosobruchus analis]
MADSDMCEQCHVPGTLDHICFERQKYYRQQEQFRAEMGKYGYHHPLNIVYVLSLNDKTGYMDILLSPKFKKKTAGSSLDEMYVVASVAVISVGDYVGVAANASLSAAVVYEDVQLAGCLVL